MGFMEGGAAARSEAKVARMVVLMVLTFLGCWLPYASLALLVVHDPDVSISPLVGTVPVYLAKSSTVYNPLIYIFLNKQVGRGRTPLDRWDSRSISIDKFFSLCRCFYPQLVRKYTMMKDVNSI